VRVPDHIIEEIAQKTDILGLVSRYVRLNKKGGRYWGLCPFHTEDTPSFSVDPDKGFFYCFGCHKGGSVFSFLMEMEKVSFPEAVRMLSQETGVSLPVPDNTSEQSDQEHRTRTALKELYKRVTGSFQYIFHNNSIAERARKYMYDRGISENTLQKFRVGYSPEDSFWLHAFLVNKGYTPEFLTHTGLFTRRNPKRALFADRIMFPISTHQRECVAFGGRSIGDGEGPKYLNSPETGIFHKKTILYGLAEGLETIRKSSMIYLVEGYMDVLAMHEAGLTEAVAPLGTSFTEDHARIVRRYADTAVLVFDADSAGREAARKTAVRLEKNSVRVKVCSLPADSDPADILKKKGPEELQNIARCTIEIMDYFIEDALSKADVSSPDGKEFVLRLIFPYIDTISSEVKKDAALQQLADLLGVEKTAVEKDFSAGGKNIPTGVENRSDSGSLSSDLFLLLAVVVHRKLFVSVRRSVGIEDLKDKRAVSLYIALEECFRADETSTERLLARIDDEDLKKCVLEKMASQEFSFNQEQAVQDAVINIRKRSLREKSIEIDTELRKLGKAGGEAWQTDELLREKIHLEQELEKLKVTAHDRPAE
jgi:DNA primase